MDHCLTYICFSLLGRSRKLTQNHFNTVKIFWKLFFPTIALFILTLTSVLGGFRVVLD